MQIISTAEQKRRFTIVAITACKLGEVFRGRAPKHTEGTRSLLRIAREDFELNDKDYRFCMSQARSFWELVNNKHNIRVARAEYLKNSTKIAA